jgi:hypothetical protein
MRRQCATRVRMRSDVHARAVRKRSTVRSNVSQIASRDFPQRHLGGSPLA